MDWALISARAAGMCSSRVERDGQGGAGQHELGVGQDRVAEALDRVGAEAQQGSHPTIVGVQGGARGGRDREPVRVAGHGGHRS